MKIAYVTKTSWADHSPGFIFSYFQANGISENGIQVTLIMQKPVNEKKKKIKFEKSSNKNLKIKLIKNSFGPLKSHDLFYKRANKYILLNDFDIIFTRDPGYLPFLVKIKSLVGKKIFYQSHNFYLDFNIHEYSRSKDRKKYNHNEKRYLKLLDGMMTLNNPQKKLYDKFVDIPVYACPPGLNPSKKRTKYENKEVVYSGSFQSLKGIEDIVDLWKTELKDFKLALIGGRNKKELSYVDSIMDGNSHSKISLHDWVFYNDLPDLITLSSVGLIVLPENFYNQYLTAPNKLYDYISFGMPVVCTDLPSVRDLIPDNHKGVVFVSPNDTKNYIKELRRLLTDKNYYEEAQESNIALSKSLSWKQQSFKLVQSMGMPQ